MKFRPQFSLRTLLTVVTAFALIVGFVAWLNRHPPRIWTTADAAELSQLIQAQIKPGCTCASIEEWLDNKRIQHGFQAKIPSGQFSFAQVPTNISMGKYSGVLQATVWNELQKASSKQSEISFYFVFDNAGRFVETWTADTVYQY
jgi:hypothetical protein